jgi:hypothetical protein
VVELTREDLSLRILELQAERDLLLAACRIALGLIPEFPRSPYVLGEREKIQAAVAAVGTLDKEPGW